MAIKKSDEEVEPNKDPDYSHLKWPAIIIVILIVIGIASLDYCSRQGTL